jgi:hypothetical protein
MYVLECKGTYWHAYKTTYSGYWTKHLRLATRMTRELANSYLPDWSFYDVKVKYVKPVNGEVVWTYPLCDNKKW